MTTFSSLKKMFAVVLGLLMLAPATLAASNSSSMFWQVSGRNFTTQSGQSNRMSMPFTIETYFSGNYINDVIFDSVEVTCSGDDVVSRLDLRQGNSILASDDFVRQGNRVSTATLDNMKSLLRNNSRYEFNLDLMFNPDADAGDFAKCQVSNVRFLDAKNNVELYNSDESEGYVSARKNAPANISVSKSSSSLFYILPPASTPTYRVLPEASTPTYRILPSSSTTIYKVLPSSSSTTYRVLPSSSLNVNRNPVVIRPSQNQTVRVITTPSSPTYKVLPSGTSGTTTPTVFLNR